jgi:hypothetical protein
LTGYGPIARRVDVAAEQVADVGELLLQHISGGAEAKSLRGRVTLPGADDAAGVTVVARFADRAEVRLAETLTDLDGAFTIAAAPDEDALDGMLVELTDRFGELPTAARNLLRTARLRLVARRLGFPKSSRRAEQARHCRLYADAN